MTESGVQNVFDRLVTVGHGGDDGRVLAAGFRGQFHTGSLPEDLHRGGGAACENESVEIERRDRAIASLQEDYVMLKDAVLTVERHRDEDLKTFEQELKEAEAASEKKVQTLLQENQNQKLMFEQQKNTFRKECWGHIKEQLRKGTVNVSAMATPLQTH